jgi:uncharacterized membrane protein (UPF0127 family)
MSRLRLTVPLLLALGAATCAAAGPSPPPSRVARELLLHWSPTGRVERICRPGSYQFEFGFGRDVERPVALHVEVTREPDAAERGGSTPEEVRQLAARGKVGPVRFRDAFAAAGAGAGEGPSTVRLPDGRAVQIGYIFSTAGGILCLVPEGAEVAELARAALPGDAIEVRGSLLASAQGEVRVLVDSLAFAAPGPGADEPPWAVRVRWEEREARLDAGTGELTVRVGKTGEGAKAGLLTVRARQFRAVDLEVKGRSALAELALTRRQKSYGLQGRSGLAPDHGMLFFFARPTRPVFVMKSVSFPLSVAFIRADGRITDIGRMDPGQGEGLTSSVPVSYVLEMERGWFRRRGIEPGDRVSLASPGPQR